MSLHSLYINHFSQSLLKAPFFVFKIYVSSFITMISSILPNHCLHFKVVSLSQFLVIVFCKPQEEYYINITFRNYAFNISEVSFKSWKLLISPSSITQQCCYSPIPPLLKYWVIPSWLKFLIMSNPPKYSNFFIPIWIV